MELRAIETWHNGRLYRSRTEARWAVFFEALREPFEYELEGFVLAPVPMDDINIDPSIYWDEEDVFYVPDFWLPRSQQWIEVKPDIGDEGYDRLTLEKAHRLAYHSGYAVRILCGTPGFVCPYQEHPSYRGYIPSDYMYLWCECQNCGAVGLEFEGRSERLSCKHGTGNDKGYNWRTDRLQEAFETAAKHRFDWRNKNARGV
jgi:hypothetical protein